MSTYKASHKARYFISLLGNLSGSLQSIWEASENMGYDLSDVLFFYSF